MVLLYGITIVGAGDQKFVAFDVVISLRVNGQWHDGVRFTPVMHPVSDKNGWSGLAVQVHVGVKKPIIDSAISGNKRVDHGDTINLLDWKNFEPGISVGFGEPAHFMVGNYFPSLPGGLLAINRMKVTVIDYLGNSYREEYGIEGLKHGNGQLYLDQGLTAQ